jgi:hypothetical protein
MVEAPDEAPADTVVRVRAVRQCRRWGTAPRLAEHPLADTREYRKMVYIYPAPVE